jgi:hypothetical protein
MADQQIEKLEDIAKNPMKHGIPGWMLNRRKDYRTGEDRHIVSSDLAYLVKLDTKIAEWEKEAITLKGVKFVSYHEHWPYFAARFGSFTILLSDDIIPESRVMYYRKINERVARVAPFVRLDPDATW